MNRRHILVLLAAATSLGFRSCQQQANDLATMTEVLANAVTALLTALGQGNSAFAQRFAANAHTAVTLLRAWKPGMSASDVLRALNRMIDDLNGFPGGDRFKPLIQLALGTIAAIMDGIRAQGGQGELPHTNIKLTRPPQSSREFREYWDAIRGGNPGMDQAPVI